MNNNIYIYKVIVMPAYIASGIIFIQREKDEIMQILILSSMYSDHIFHIIKECARILKTQNLNSLIISKHFDIESSLALYKYTKYCLYLCVRFEVGTPLLNKTL